MRNRLPEFRPRFSFDWKNITQRQLMVMTAAAIAAMFGYLALGLRRQVPVPYAIEIPGLAPLSMYSIVVFLAIASTVVLFKYLVRNEKGLHDTDVWDLLAWILIPGLIGARLFHVATQWEIYQLDTSYILAVWEGGLNIWGGLILGGLSLFIYSRRHKLEFWRLAAVIAIIVPFAHMLGRMASFFAREYYGAPTNLAWGAYIEPAFRFWGLESVEYYHPVFLYEMVGNLIIFSLLIWLWNRRQLSLVNQNWQYSSLVKIYLVCYGIVRYLLDFLLITPKTSLGLTYTQIFILCVLALIIAVGWGWQAYYFVRYRKLWHPDNQK